MDLVGSWRQSASFLQPSVRVRAHELSHRLGIHLGNLSSRKLGHTGAAWWSDYLHRFRQS